MLLHDLRAHEHFRHMQEQDVVHYRSPFPSFNIATAIILLVILNVRDPL